MVLAEYHQTQTWLYKYICYLLFEGVLDSIFEGAICCLLFEGAIYYLLFEALQSIFAICYLLSETMFTPTMLFTWPGGDFEGGSPRGRELDIADNNINTNSNNKQT